MKWLSAKFHLLNILNLDVAAGAVGMALWVSTILGLQIHPLNYYLLFSAVWTIYLVDHLYDSRKPEAVSERRKFFKKYHKPFLWVLILNIFLTLMVFIWQFNVLLVIYASPAIGITFVYILANWLFQENHQRFYLKEIFISIGYALGIMVIPLSIRRTVDTQVAILTVLIILMALWNLLLIARFERAIDEKEGQTSMSQWLSSSNIRRINIFLFILFIGAGVYYGLSYDPRLRLIIIFTLISAYMAIPLLFPRIFRRKERYHRYVDMVFLISFLCLLPF
jgi:hypothetical protein